MEGTRSPDSPDLIPSSGALRWITMGPSSSRWMGDNFPDSNNDARVCELHQALGPEEGGWLKEVRGTPRLEHRGKVVKMELARVNEAFRPPPSGISAILEAQAISRCPGPSVWLLCVLVAMPDSPHLEENDEGKGTRGLRALQHSYNPLTNSLWQSNLQW